MADRPVEHLRSQWFPASLDKTTLSAYPILKGCGSYLRSQLTKVGGKVTEELHRIAKLRKTEKGGDQNGKQDDFVNVLNNMPLEVLSEYVSAETTTLKTARSDLSGRRRKGVHRYSAKTEKFISEFDRFLTAYSGIVNIVTLADQQYGGVACATLALLFSTVKMKIKDEESIISAMQHITDRLPDFKVYEKIYPDPLLRSMLVDAYTDIILLAREATSYFYGSSFSRHVRSMGNPAEFELTEQRLRDKFSRIRLKCESLLAQRIDSLTKDLEESLKRNDRNLISRLRTSLLLDDYRIDEAENQLTGYREYLEAKFDKDRHRQKLGLSEFLTDDACQSWTSGGSVVVVLSGTNETGIASIEESWLSSVAVDMTRDLLERRQMVAFEMCNETSTFETVLARLIYQLLDKNPRAIRRADDWHYIETHLSSHELDRERLTTALLKIVDLQKGPVFLILDRPEMNEEEDTAEYIRSMLLLAKETKGELKVLIVQRSEKWDLESNMFGVTPKGLDPRLLQSIRRDQHRIR